MCLVNLFGRYISLLNLHVFCRLCCIAPVLAARVFPGCEVTVGKDTEEEGKWPYAGTVEALKAMGAKHVIKDVCVSFKLYNYLGPHDSKLDWKYPCH